MQDRAVLLFAGVQSSSAGLQTQPTWHLQSVRRLQQPALRCGRASESVPEPRSTRKRRRELLCLDVPAQYARTTGPVLLQQQRTLPPICAHTPDNSRHACKQIQSEQPGKGRQPAFRSRPTNAGKAQGSCSPQNRSNQQAEDIDEPNLAQQRSTVRMSRLPGGKVVNGKPSPGFVSLRSGKRIMCPRCEGSGWLGGGSVRSSLLMPGLREATVPDGPHCSTCRAPELALLCQVGHWKTLWCPQPTVIPALSLWKGLLANSNTFDFMQRPCVAEGPLLRRMQRPKGRRVAGNGRCAF